jgi:hypothetical protein
MFTGPVPPSHAVIERMRDHAANSGTERPIS